MIEKTHWEVVDAPAAQTRQSPQQLLKSLLGPWWRWKVAGFIVVAAVALVLFAAIAGVFLVMVVTGVVLSLGIRAVLRLLRGSHTTDMTARNRK